MPVHSHLPATLRRLAYCACALGLALAATGCGDATSADPLPSQTEGSAASDANKVETVRVERRDLSQTIEMPGTVEGYETADLYSKVGGYLEEIHVDIGDEVTKGQELARLHIPEMAKQLQQRKAALEQAKAEVVQAEAAVEESKAFVDSAEAALEEARSEKASAQASVDLYNNEHNRYHSLVEQNAARRDLLDESKYRLDAARAEFKSVQARIRTSQSRVAAARATLAKAQADLKAAQAAVEVARADLEYTETMMQYARIRAPFDGQITKRWVHPGDFIQSADGNSAAKPLLTVTRLDRVRVFLDLPMAEVRLLNRGDRAVLDRINVLPGESFDGEVTRFSPALDLGSRMMRIEIHLDNPDFKLRPGYYGYATIYLQQLPDTPVVPSSALMSQEGGARFVYVIRDGHAERRPVTVNYEDGIIVGIASGLEGGEQIIRAGGGQIVDGQTVEPVLVQADGDLGTTG